MRHVRRSIPILLLGLALAAGPLSAYTIYLRDGKTLLAKGKYRIENGRAIITLPNGTQTFLDAREIDVKRTETENRGGDLGNAMVLENNRPADPKAATPPAQRRLSDMINNREAPREPQLPQENRRETASSNGLGRTRAGFPDLTGIPRKPYARLEVASDLQQFFRGQSLDEVEIYNGTQGDRPLLEITTNSEASVFKALTAAANALLHIRDSQPNRVAAFELLLTTPERERAGQFLITPELAADLVAQKVEVSQFFIQNVQF
jgi:hypothetical protein